MTQTSASISSPRQTPPKAAAKNSGMFLLLGAGGVGIFLLIVLVGGFFLLRNIFGSGAVALASTNTPEANIPAATNTIVVVAAEPQEEPTFTLTPEPTVVPTDTVVPTNTFPALYVQITNITLNGSQYVVEYETYGFTEQLPGMHIHFFFNTVTPEQAGMPGSGPWILYGGPRPFTKYGVGDKPSAATQMCVLVANANHSVIFESGNCFDLP